MIFGAITRLSTAGKQNKMAKAIKVPEFKEYEESPYAKEMMGVARGRVNSRMPGANLLERNIGQSQANAMGQVQRNATDSGTAIAAAMATQAGTNQALNNLQLSEAQDQARRDANLTQAQGVMIGEGNKVYESREGWRREQQGRRDAFTMASQHNKATSFDGLDQAIGTAAGLALNPAGVAIGGKKKPNRTDLAYNYKANKSNTA